MEKALSWGFKYWDCEQLNPTPRPKKPAWRIPKSKETKAGRRRRNEGCKVREWGCGADRKAQAGRMNTRSCPACPQPPKNREFQGMSLFLHSSVCCGAMALFVFPGTLLPAALPPNPDFQQLCKAPSVKLDQSSPKKSKLLHGHPHPLNT